MEDLPPCNETEIPGKENGSTNNGYVNRNRINPYTSNLGINDPTHMDLDSDRSSSEENSIQDHDFPLPQPEMELDESPHDEFSDPGSLVEQGLDDDHDVNVDWNQWFLAGIQSCMQDNEQSAQGEEGNDQEVDESKEMDVDPLGFWYPFPKKEYLIACLMLGNLRTMMSRAMCNQNRLILSTICNLDLPHWDTIRRTRLRIPSDFYKAYYEIKLEGVPFHKKCNGRIHEVWGPTETNEILFPNKWRTIANGKIIRHVPIVLYADDTSGNRSKRWNKHVSYYFTLAGLPPVLSNMQYNCHFITTSNRAGALELAEPIVAELNELSSQGCVAYDCGLKKEVLIMSMTLCFLGDSPMAAEVTNTPHPGSSNNPCRTCHLRSKNIDSRCSKDYLEQFFGHPSMPVNRTWPETIANSHDLWESYKDDTEKEFEKKYHLYGLKDNINFELMELKKKSAEYHSRINELEENTFWRLFNPTLELICFDGCTDTPVEVLHVVLLGPVKYLFADFMEGIKNSPVKLKELEARWSAFNTESLNVPHIQAKYMVKHAGSFVGKEFRIVLQAAPFVLFPLMTKQQREIWYELCYLGSLIFQTRISNMDEYLEELTNVIRIFLFHIAKMNGRWANKPKFHMLLHLVASIRRYGPAALFATEKFESFNGVVRESSVHSNHISPSRDIAICFSSGNNIRLMLSGAYMFDHKKKTYFQASGRVMGLFDHVLIQKSLGYNSALIDPSEKHPCIHNSKVPSSDQEPTPEVLSNMLHQFKLRQISSVKLNHQKMIRKGAFVWEEGYNRRAPGVGCVESIWEVIETGDFYVMMNPCRFTSKHQICHMRMLDKQSHSIFAPTRSILCCLNVQHNCFDAKCEVVETRLSKNPRHEGSSLLPHISHKSLNSYILNAFSHHEPEMHRVLSGLQHFPISPELMNQALDHGLALWKAEKAKKQATVPTVATDSNQNADRCH
ncbi:hypothetical protein MJO29_011667 [Puccinia striiformis f. sp. tritici]|nr:hypothetical protein MJO29_011667 [Puccinia striiformis f. sp. tritici]